MADRDLTNILDKRAAFGANFLGTTNLAQRRRYQEDIEAAEVNRQNMRRERLGAAMEAAELEDPVKVGRLRLDLQQEKRIADDADLDYELEQEKFKLRQAEERVGKAAAVEKLRMTRAVMEGEAALRASGFMPGQKAYADGLLSILAQNPFIEPGYRSGLLKGTGIDIDESELMSKLVRMKESGALSNARVSLSVGPDGRESFRIFEAAPPAEPKPPPVPKEFDPDKQRMDMISRYESFVEKANAAKKNKEMDLYEYYNGLATGAKARMFEFEKPKSAPAPVTPGVQLNPSQPQAAQKPIVPLRLDGGKLIPR